MEIYETSLEPTETMLKLTKEDLMKFKKMVEVSEQMGEVAGVMIAIKSTKAEIKNVTLEVEEEQKVDTLTEVFPKAKSYQNGKTFTVVENNIGQGFVILEDKDGNQKTIKHSTYKSGYKEL